MYNIDFATLDSDQRSAVGLWRDITGIVDGGSVRNQTPIVVMVRDLMSSLAALRFMLRAGQITDTNWRWILGNMLADSQAEITHAIIQATGGGDANAVPGRDRQNPDIHRHGK